MSKKQPLRLQRAPFFSPKSPKSDAFESTGQTFSDRDFRNAKKQVFPRENLGFRKSKNVKNPLGKTKLNSIIFGPEVEKATYLSAQDKRFLNAISGT